MRYLISLFAFLPLVANGQSVTKKLQEVKVGTISCHFAYVAEPGSDTTYYVWCGFQNLEYSAITDIGSVMVASQTELEEFITNLEKCLPFLDEKSQMRIDKKGYALIVYDFSKGQLYVTDEKGKYTHISKAQVQKWIDWLKTIKFPE
jgi:hypothetical protein